MQVRSLAMFLFAAVVAGPSPCVHAAELTAKDMRAIERMAREMWEVSASLHASTYRFPDGVKGLGVVLMPDRVATGFGPPFVNQRQQDLYDFYCPAYSLVLARNIDSKGVLSPDQAMIFTIAHFQVIDSLKAAVGMHVNDLVTTWSAGGDVTDAGERLRVAINDPPSFKPGQLYLLELGQDFLDTSPVFSASTLFSLAGDDRHLRIDHHLDGKPSYELDLRGDSRTYDQFRADVLRAVALKACP